MAPPKKADWSEKIGKKATAGVTDMTLLSKVSNEAINENLQKRHSNAEIYTYIGHVLISINPFKDLGIYTSEILKSYTGKNRIEMPPHVFAIAESAYYKMNAYKENQCIIISGESGAGKTEAAKRIMQYIATVATGQSTQIQEIKDMVLATNPLLESFGCAKTLRNNNSSRHGKYLEIQFNAQGEPVGAVITNYLLEKGRVVRQIENERNFHIFYQFCKAASPAHREMFGIQGPESYLYTCRSNCLNVAGMDDTEEYAETLKAMSVIGLSATEQDDIHRILSAILWLGNVQYTETEGGRAQITDLDITSWVAHLLEVDEITLEKALTTKLIETMRGGQRASSYESPLNAAQAGAVRDAFSKALYDRLFEWIVARINDALRQRTSSSYMIGVLDIYGFEIFEQNSFEQLCINYVNEKLQQIFIELTLKAEQEEYVREQIQWTPIEFFNNKIVCELIEGKRPPGVFAALNDACATAHADPAAADQSFIQRLGMCAQNPHFEGRGERFLVKHYAGDVLYEVAFMTDKNKDQLVWEVLGLVGTSTNSFVQTLFPDKIDPESTKKRPPTAGDRIRTSAGELVAKLMQSQPSYIRCIKPNENKSPAEFDVKRVLHQVKYLGLCENVRVRRAGFAYRQLFDKFVERFYLLSPRTSYAGEYTWKGDAKSAAQVIFADIGIATGEWQLGVTKAFIRKPETLFALETLRDKYWHNMAIRIQRAYRSYVRYKHECATRIQRCYRRNRDQMSFVQTRDHGHTLLAGRKERRRFSLISMRRFMGDYLCVGSGIGNEGEMIRQTCGFQGALEKLIFSSRIQLLVPRPMRSSRPSPRILVVTTAAIYIIVLAVEKRRVDMQLERKIAMATVVKVSLSEQRDDWMVLHVQNDQDAIFICPFKTELATLMNMHSESRIQINVSNQVEYTKPNKKTEAIKFVKDESVTGEATYKKHVVAVGSGMPANSVSNPPCKTAEKMARPVTTGKLLRPGGPGQQSVQPPSTGGRHIPPRPTQQQPRSVPNPPVATTPATIPALPNRREPPPLPGFQPEREPEFEIIYKAIYAFRPQEDGEIEFEKGEVMEVLEKDENGWWLAKKDGKEGWVPSNYLEECKIPKKSGAPPALPPSFPPRGTAGPTLVQPKVSPASQPAVPVATPKTETSEERGGVLHSSNPTLPNRISPHHGQNTISASQGSVNNGSQEIPSGKPSWMANSGVVNVMPGAGVGSNGVPSWKAELAARKAAKAGSTATSVESLNDTKATETMSKPPASKTIASRSVPTSLSAYAQPDADSIDGRLQGARSSNTINRGPDSIVRRAPPPVAPKPVIPPKPSSLSSVSGTSNAPKVPGRSPGVSTTGATQRAPVLSDLLKQNRQSSSDEKTDDDWD